LHNRDPNLISRLRQGKPIFLADGGRSFSSFVYVGDVARAILAVASSANVQGKIYNCAYPVPTTGRVYFEIVARQLGVKLHVINVPLEVIVASDWGWGATAFSRVVDSTSLLSDVGVIPDTPLEQAIRATLDVQMNQPTSEQQGLSDFFDMLTQQLILGQDAITDLLNRGTKLRAHSRIDDRMNIPPMPKHNFG